MTMLDSVEEKKDQIRSTICRLRCGSLHLRNRSGAWLDQEQAETLCRFFDNQVLKNEKHICILLPFLQK